MVSDFAFVEPFTSIRHPHIVWTLAASCMQWTTRALAACSTRRLSESAKSSRFLADQPIGTDSGRAVHPMRAALGQYPCHRRCRGYCPKALLNRRRAEEQVVPDYGVESDGVVTRSMEGKQAETVPLSRARDDCPLLARHTAAVLCFSSLSQPHNSLTNHTAC